ncbi:MAG: hypothetical protein GX207_11885, partial [Peptococcaceae bacterium]|nr:hypothetical protein [Peptococcaceae bacterium]
MRFYKILLFVIIFFSLFGCSQETNISGKQDPVTDPANAVEEEPIEEAPIAEEIKTEEYDTRLIFIKNTGENWLVVDERGLVHKIDSLTVD